MVQWSVYNVIITTKLFVTSFIMVYNAPNKSLKSWTRDSKGYQVKQGISKHDKSKTKFWKSWSEVNVTRQQKDTRRTDKIYYAQHACPLEARSIIFCTLLHNFVLFNKGLRRAYFRISNQNGWMSCFNLWRRKTKRSIWKKILFGI